MDWIDRHQSEQQAEEERRRAATEEQRARAGEVAAVFQVVVERLAPQIRNSIQRIETQLNISLRLEIGKDHLIIEHGEKRPWSKHYFVKIEKRESSSDLFIEATEDGSRYTPVPSDWQGTATEWRGEEPPVLHLRTSLQELETQQLGRLLEWITGSAMGKPTPLPFQAEALAQRRKEEKVRETSINAEKNASRALIFALVSIPIFFLSPLALGLGLFTRWQLLTLGRRTGFAKINWAIGISIVMVIYLGSFIIAMSKLPLG